MTSTVQLPTDEFPMEALRAEGGMSIRCPYCGKRRTFHAEHVRELTAESINDALVEHKGALVMLAVTLQTSHDCPGGATWVTDPGRGVPRLSSESTLLDLEVLYALDCKVRPAYALQRAGIRTVRDLVALTQREVEAVPGIGFSGMQSLLAGLERHHLRLAGNY